MNIKMLVTKISGRTIRVLAGLLDYYLFPSRETILGGPFNGQIFRQQMFLEIIKIIGFAAIVETGTFRGTTTDYLQKISGLPVYTVEIAPRYYAYAKARFLLNKNITTYYGDSKEFLRRLAEDLNLVKQKVFFYLDAHWGGPIPLKPEIQIIFENFPRAIVMIDDFRVPGDEQYGYDNYGPGKALSLEYLNRIYFRLNLAAFFPSKRAEFETGSKRGCVVLTRAPDLIENLTALNTLIRHS